MTTELRITNPDGTKSPIKQEKIAESKKTLGIYDSPSGGNKGHLSFIVDKATQWVNRMKNGHLPSHVAWIAYKHQLWPGLRYGLGTMTNDMKLQISSSMRPTTRRSTFWGFSVTSPPDYKNFIPHLADSDCSASQQSNLLAKSKCSSSITIYPQLLVGNLDASLRYLQLQLGTPQNLLMLDFTKWGHLAPLSWVKMLWKSLHHFNIQLYVSFPMIPNPREQGQVIMDIFFLQDLGSDNIKSMNRCRGGNEGHILVRLIHSGWQIS
jgi:hypothetical protein